LPLSAALKEKAVTLGFSFCGIAKARFLEEEAPRLEDWLKRGQHGQMQWMENHFDKRLDPRLLVEGTKSVISLLYNYAPHPDKGQAADAGMKVSCYAWGQDYHTVVKNKLNALLEWLTEASGRPVTGRAFVDSAPVMDKAWARIAGLGWIGKHTNLIRPGAGSYYFIGELLVDIELEYDGPMADYCGTCRRCQDACPTDALAVAYKLDATRCISYLTIELREAIPTEFASMIDGWAYGCDICQQVCPWNRFATPHSEPAFLPNQAMATYSAQDYQAMSEGAFKRVFAGSAVQRARYAGFMRNIAFVSQ
jgi:epoxyqueuosine reductase